MLRMPKINCLQSFINNNLRFFSLIINIFYKSNFFITYISYDAICDDIFVLLYFSLLLYYILLNILYMYIYSVSYADTVLIYNCNFFITIQSAFFIIVFHYIHCIPIKVRQCSLLLKLQFTYESI